MRTLPLLLWLTACAGDDATDPPVDGTAADTGAVETESTTSSTETGYTTSTTDTSPTTPTTPADDSLQQLCVDTINGYRSTLGLPPYARWESGEACADGQSQDDAASGIPHGAFGECGEWAQNECPGWRGSYEAVLDGCLAMMWAEGPGADFQQHGHYINMSSTQYTQVACGFHTTPGGEVWAIQNFR